MATKYLDLDSLVTSDIRIRLNGKEHLYRDMTVGDFIWAQKEAEKNEAEMTDEEKFDSMTEIVRRSFPTVERDDLVNLPVSKLTALVTFIISLAKPEEGEGDPGKEATTTTSPS